MFWPPEQRARSGQQPGLHSVNSEYLNSQTPHKGSAGECVQCVPPSLQNSRAFLFFYLSACNTGGDGEVVNVRVIDGGWLISPHVQM